jgi:hypothetical protein
LGYDSVAATGRTDINCRARLSSRPSATAAWGLATEIDVGDEAIDGVVERNVEVGGGVATLLRSGSAPRTAESEEVAEPAEDVAQVLCPDSLPSEAATAESTTLAPVVAKGARLNEAAQFVILLALLGVREHSVGLRDLFELLFSRAVPGVGIGMKLLCELSISALDLLGRSRANHTEDLIEVLVNPVAIQDSIIPCGA